MKKKFSLWIGCVFLMAFFPNFLFGIFGGEKSRVEIHNLILTKVNDDAISLLDVVKKMDLFFHSNYPDLANQPPARYQFYLSSWQHFLQEMIYEKLMMADAETKEVTVSDGDVREEMENRFGPNIMVSLEETGITFDEAWKMIKDEMVAERMQGHYIYSKAHQSLNPQAVREEYRKYCLEHPTIEEWEYQVISIKSPSEKEGEKAAMKAYEILSKEGNDPLKIQDQLSSVEKEFPSTMIQVSKEYKVNSKEISATHHSVLADMKTNTFHPPVEQKSRFSQEAVHRIFFLKDYVKKETPAFEEIAEKMRDQLYQKSIAEKAQEYHVKLMKKYGYESTNIEEMIPKDFVPFSLQ